MKTKTLLGITALTLYVNNMGKKTIINQKETRQTLTYQQDKSPYMNILNITNGCIGDKFILNIKSYDLTTYLEKNLDIDNDIPFELNGICEITSINREHKHIRFKLIFTSIFNKMYQFNNPIFSHNYLFTEPYKLKNGKYIYIIEPMVGIITSENIVCREEHSPSSHLYFPSSISNNYIGFNIEIFSNTKIYENIPHNHNFYSNIMQSQSYESYLKNNILTEKEVNDVLNYVNYAEKKHIQPMNLQNEMNTILKNIPPEGINSSIRVIEDILAKLKEDLKKYQ
jgi:hypothetical protein